MTKARVPHGTKHEIYARCDEMLTHLADVSSAVSIIHEKTGQLLPSLDQIRRILGLLRELGEIPPWMLGAVGELEKQFKKL